MNNISIKLKRIVSATLIISFICVTFSGCKKESSSLDVPMPSPKEIPEKISEEFPQETASTVLHFVDVFNKEYEVEINNSIPMHYYDNTAFIHNGDKLSYNDNSFTSRMGVDVSKYQNNVNWNKVKAAGYDFAFLRIGFRGYGQAGNIVLDSRFYNHIKGAKDAGLDVGVYFFSQAINEEEAIEEANFVLDSLKDYSLELPIVYDPESILDDVARTDNLTKEQFTKNTIAFCDTIKTAGYTPAVYCNMLWEAYNLDLSAFPDTIIWYADYEPSPQTPYHFNYWQYSESAHVDGISGECDVDIEMISHQ